MRRIILLVEGDILVGCGERALENGGVYVIVAHVI